MANLEERVDRLNEQVSDVRVQVAKQQAQISSVASKVNEVHVGVGDLTKLIIDDKTRENSRLWKWLRIALVALMGGGVAAGAIEGVKLATNGAASADPPAIENPVEP